MTSQILEKPILVQNSGYRSAMWKLEASSAHTLKMDFAVKKRIRGHYKYLNVVIIHFVCLNTCVEGIFKVD